MAYDEKLIQTPSIQEAVALIEAFLFGKQERKVWITGDAGSGKSFLAGWAREQTQNGKRGAIYDDLAPDINSSFWLAFSRSEPDKQLTCEPINLNPPEYERKRGVLEEWAAARDLNWEPEALQTLLAIKTDNLQLLRSLAQRIAMQAILPEHEIREIDVLRTLGQTGHISELS